MQKRYTRDKKNANDQFFWFKCVHFKVPQSSVSLEVVTKHQSSFDGILVDNKKTRRNEFVILLVLLHVVSSNWKSIFTRYLCAPNAAASNETILYSPHSLASSQSLLFGANGSRPCWIVTNQIRGQVFNGIGGTFLDQFRHACKRMRD